MKYHKTTDKELSLMLEEREGYHLEFKTNVNADLPKELVALANASGGRILIGVSDRNQVVGTDLANKTLAQIEVMAAACDPPVAIRIEKLAKHKLLVIHVPEGANRPHRCAKGFYLRNGAGSQKMSTRDITAFIQAEGRIRFDSMFTLEFPRPTYIGASPPHVTRQVRNLLDVATGERSRSQLMAALSLRDRMNFSNQYLEPALDAGLLEMTQPDSPRSPTQKYRLTAKGRALLENLEKGDHWDKKG